MYRITDNEVMIWPFFLSLILHFSQSFAGPPTLEKVKCSPEQAQKLISKGSEELKKLQLANKDFSFFSSPKTNYEKKFIHDYLGPFHNSVESEIDAIRTKLRSRDLSPAQIKKLKYEWYDLTQTEVYWTKYYEHKWSELPSSIAALESSANRQIDHIVELERDYRKMLAKYEAPQTGGHPFRQNGQKLMEQDQLAFKMAKNREEFALAYEKFKLTGLKGAYLQKMHGPLRDKFTPGMTAMTMIFGSSSIITQCMGGSEAGLNRALLMTGLGFACALIHGGKGILDGHKVSPSAFESKLAKKWSSMEKEFPPLDLESKTKIRVAQLDHTDNPPHLQVKKRVSSDLPDDHTIEELETGHSEIEDYLSPRPNLKITK